MNISRIKTLMPFYWDLLDKGAVAWQYLDTWKSDGYRWRKLQPILGAQPYTIYKWISRKSMPAHKMGLRCKFKRSEVVAGVLRKMGVRFQVPHEDNEIICDFHLPGPPRIAIECKANPDRDWDRTLTTVALFHKDLFCDKVIVVTAFKKGDLEESIRSRLKDSRMELISIKSLKSRLQAALKK